MLCAFDAKESTPFKILGLLLYKEPLYSIFAVFEVSMTTWGNETAYISKYALTTGIIICTDGEFYPSGRYFGRPPGWTMAGSFASSEAHKTLEEALAASEKKRDDKIASLKKQIKKLEDLKIKVQENK